MTQLPPSGQLPRQAGGVDGPDLSTLPPPQGAPHAQAPQQTSTRPPFVPSAAPRLLEMPVYPHGYSPYIAGHIDPHAPGTVFLAVPGAAVPVYVAHADGPSPQLWLGTKRAGGGLLSASNVAVPTVTGTTLRLKWIQNWSGFPDVKLGNTYLYRTPGLTNGDRAAMLFTRLAPLVLGLLPGYFLGIALARWMSTMIKRGASPALRRWGPALIAGSPLILILLVILLGALVSLTET